MSEDAKPARSGEGKGRVREPVGSRRETAKRQLKRGCTTLTPVNQVRAPEPSEAVSAAGSLKADLQ